LKAPPDVIAARRAALHVSMKERIAKYGYTMQYVFPSEEDNSPGFFYTIGLCARGWPEIFLSGNLGQETGARFIHDVIELWEKTGKPVLGVIPDFLELVGKKGSFAAETVLVDSQVARNNYTFQVENFYPEVSYDVAQLLWPDPEGNLPNNPQYVKDPRYAQVQLPLLAPPQTLH